MTDSYVTQLFYMRRILTHLNTTLLYATYVDTSHIKELCNTTLLYATYLNTTLLYV